MLADTGHDGFRFESIGIIGSFGCPFVRAGVQKLSPFDLAGFIDEDTQRLAGAVQAVIDQGRKGGLQGMMFYALGHGADSFVGDKNGPKKSPLDSPCLLRGCGVVLRTSGASALVATDDPAAPQQADNLQKACCTNAVVEIQIPPE